MLQCKSITSTIQSYFARSVIAATLGKAGTRWSNGYECLDSLQNHKVRLRQMGSIGFIARVLKRPLLDALVTGAKPGASAKAMVLLQHGTVVCMYTVDWPCSALGQRLTRAH